MENISQVYEFYNNGAEIDRLEHGLGAVEFYRSKEIISRYLNGSNLTIYDIGGGIGKYSQKLAELGHNVTLVELAPNAVEYSKELSENNLNIYTCLICPVCRYNTLKYVSIPALISQQFLSFI